MAVVLVAAAAVLASFSSLQLASATQADPWNIQSAVERFQGAASRLPAEEDLGYISDLPVQDSNGTLVFLSAQYALAPRLLTPIEDNAPGEAIGNFSKRQDYAAAGAKAGYRVEADLGNGVILYRKAK